MPKELSFTKENDVEEEEFVSNLKMQESRDSELKSNKKKKHYVFLTHAIEKYNSTPFTPMKKIWTIKNVSKNINNFVINTNHAKVESETIQAVIQWNPEFKESRNIAEGDLLWYCGVLKDLDYKLINNRECIYNKYPKGHVFAWKKELTHYIEMFQRFFPQSFDIIPRTFNLPEEAGALKKFMNLKSEPKPLMIAKPSKGACGVGIFLAWEFGNKNSSGNSLYQIKN